MAGARAAGPAAGGHGRALRGGVRRHSRGGGEHRATRGGGRACARSRVQENLATRRALCERVEGARGRRRAPRSRRCARRVGAPAPLPRRRRALSALHAGRRRRARRATSRGSPTRGTGARSWRWSGKPKRWRHRRRCRRGSAGVRSRGAGRRSRRRPRTTLQRRFATAKEQLERRRQEGEQRADRGAARRTWRASSRSAPGCRSSLKAEAASLRAARRELRAVEAALQDLGPLPPSERREAWTERLSAARDELMGRLGRRRRRRSGAAGRTPARRRRSSSASRRCSQSNDLAEGTRQLGRLQEEWAAGRQRDAGQVAGALGPLPSGAQRAPQALRRLPGGEPREEARALRAGRGGRRVDGVERDGGADPARPGRVEGDRTGAGEACAGALEAVPRAVRPLLRAPKEHWERVDAERRENARQKTALCEQAEALADSTDWESTAAAMKRLQAEWKRGGPLPRAEAEALWQRFRGACDRFFDRRSRREEIAREETLQKARAVCDELEALAASLEGRTLGRIRRGEGRRGVGRVAAAEPRDGGRRARVGRPADPGACSGSRRRVRRA